MTRRISFHLTIPQLYNKSTTNAQLIERTLSLNLCRAVFIHSSMTSIRIGLIVTVQWCIAFAYSPLP